ncbi:MAG TPA: multicopper oxidase domain-containing protein [Rubrivivax sp.]|nr:multicopper oxidase domain-containing protein [Rubrivivax sp.]HPP83628.1 multicopper oxidase domain-containing protein [Rubrivivax sp.]
MIGAAALCPAPALLRGAWAAQPGMPLPVPPAVEVGSSGAALLEAIDGMHRFSESGRTPTRGFSQPYLGPVLRLRRDATARIDVRNRLADAITVHWHGLHVPGDVDGGPHSEIAPGATWRPSLEIDQPAGTAWYHSHVHGGTGPQVYSGLAGMILVDDPAAADSGLPQQYGTDDLPLVVQDRLFTTDGRLAYAADGMMAMMSGVRGDQIVVNGAIRPIANVPAGIVRLRLLNACNARILYLRFEDGRDMHQIASDGGLLPQPVARKSLRLATGERAEVLVDFGAAGEARLLSAQDDNQPMPMMGGARGGNMGAIGVQPPAVAPDGAFEVMRLRTVAGHRTATYKLPARLAGAARPPEPSEPLRRRRFVLDTMGGMMGGMGGGIRRGGMGMMSMTINGRAFDMARTDFSTRRGETELWEVRAGDMAHPFHVHGTSFQVLSLNGQPVSFAATGWKDTLLVERKAELLLRFDRAADERTPYMFHCHILEHEDAGMMGQFTVA